MLEKRSRLAILVVATVALLLVVDLMVQGAGQPQTAATADLNAVRTKAVQEFASGLTGTAESIPSATATRTGTATPAAVLTATGSGTPVCLGLHFVRDVTIPDNTNVTPAQVFTKSWEVQNSGTCPWKPGFQVVLTGGIAMGGSPFRVAQTVGPGGTIQVSIKMAAPTNVKGIAQGTWNMADDTGAVFGDFLSVVVVVNTGTTTPGASRTPTAPAVTPTQ
jgi:hypothetical protein